MVRNKFGKLFYFILACIFQFGNFSYVSQGAKKNKSSVGHVKKGHKKVKVKKSIRSKKGKVNNPKNDKRNRELELIVKQGNRSIVDVNLNIEDLKLPSSQIEIDDVTKIPNEIRSIVKENVNIVHENGKPIIKDLLRMSLEPVKNGGIMYIWGGGRETIECSDGKKRMRMLSSGFSQHWGDFANQQGPDYDFHTFSQNQDQNVKMQDKDVDSNSIANGLDCSGYINWLIYDFLSSKYGDAGTDKIFGNYKGVYARNIASFMGNILDFGSYSDFRKIDSVKPGDIISMQYSREMDEDGNNKKISHVYVSFGQCSDKSVLLVDVSPQFLRMRGTPDENGTKDKSDKYVSEAITLARNFMCANFAEYTRKHLRDPYDISNYTLGVDDYRLDSKMSWNLSESGRVFDPDGINGMSPKEVLKCVFNWESTNIEVEQNDDQGDAEAA